MMDGYAGNILRIDLKREKAEIGVFSAKDAKNYIGGLGYAIKLVYDETVPNLNPLDPENVLVLTAGPIGGTMAPAGDGYAFATKSPLTGGIAVSTEQGFIAGEMKRAGFDAIILRGKSAKPTFVWIHDGMTEFVDARDLWGNSPERTEETIRKDLGENSIRVAAIGLAGERLARIACVISDRTRVAGRAGIGAVMGSKNLKAIAILGHKDVDVADPEGLLEFNREFFLKAKGSTAVKYYEGLGTSENVSVKDRFWASIFDSPAKYRDLGSAEDILLFNRLGCLPTRNFNESVFEDSEKVSGEYLNEQYVEKIQACSPCPIGCEHIAVVREGPYRGSVARMEYETLWAFGPHCGVNKLDAIIKAIELCNFYGLDATSTGNIIGFAMDCFERGILNYENSDFIDLRFGNHQAMLEMIKKIGTREAFGDPLAEGVMRVAQKLGKEAEMLANHIKGLEMPGYDLRCLRNAALGFAVSFTGADANRNMVYLFDIKGKATGFKGEEGVGKLVMNMEDFQAVMDSLVICKFLSGIYEGFTDLARITNIVTGFKMSAKELEKVGERITNLARIFNIREGLTRKNDHLPPKIMFNPITKGISKGAVFTQEELDLLLDDYYRTRGWTKDGIPSQKKIDELNIEENKRGANQG